jgi:hypothetical protein
MLSLLSLFPKHQLSLALDDYPLFKFPYEARETELPRDQALKNYDYFIEVKDQRLQLMRDWFQSHFHLDFDLTQQGAAALSRWLDRYAKYAIDDHYSNFDVAFDTYKPAWLGRYRCLNLIYDTGIYYGEHVISRHPFLYWSFYDELPAEPGKRTLSYYRPKLSGFGGVWITDPLKMSFDFYRGAAMLKARGEKAKPGRFLERVALADYGAEHYPPKIY